MGLLARGVSNAVRTLARQPAVSAAILLTFALGIGANTAVFAVVHGVLLRPLPYPEPDQLVVIWEQRPAEGNYRNVVSPADFLDWSRLSQSLSAVSGYALDTSDLTGSGDPVQVTVANVSAPFFTVLGVAPALGRAFHTDEDVLGQHHVVILSHHVWQQRFGSDPTVLGRRIVLNGEAYEVIGIMRQDFEFPGEAADVWMPLALRGEQKPLPRASHYLTVYARLRPGISVEAAHAELSRIGETLSATYPVENEGHGPHVVSMREDAVGPARSGLLMVMSAVSFLLLIACVNVANLLLARGSGRQRELAIRAAMGATRWRLLRSSLAESAVFAVAGTIVGLLVAWWTLQVLVAETPPALSGVGLDRATLDPPVVGFAVLVCALAALFAGALPAWQAARTEPSDPLREFAGRSPLTLRRGIRMLLVSGQVALTVVLLIGAGLMARTFWQVVSQPSGLDTTSRLTANVTLPRTRYPDADALRRARRALDERVSTIPGVLAFGVNNNLPLSGSDSRRGITVEDLVRTPGDSPVRAHVRIVTPGYFGAVGIVLDEGRLFAAGDDERAPLVVVVNDTMARRYWPGRSAVGKRMRFNDTDAWREVVGVIRDVKHWGLDQEVNPEVYLPYDQQPSASLTYVLYTSGDPMSTVAALATRVKAVDPDLPLGLVQTFDEIEARSVAARRWSALLLGVFAVIGIALAAAGIYGVTSHLVALRRGEIGIRLSLGARRSTILGGVLGEALTNAGLGLAVGLPVGIGVARVLQSLLFGVQPGDLVTFASAAAIVVAMAALAALSPALRAMRTDPAQALRQG